MWCLALLHTPIRRAHQIERCERGIAMQLSGRCGTCLTVEEPGELFASAEEKLDRETRGVEVEKCMTIQRLSEN